MELRLYMLYDYESCNRRYVEFTRLTDFILGESHNFDCERHDRNNRLRKDTSFFRTRRMK
jgi:hypothetical protein